MQMKDFALKYCKLGLSVIPISPYNKHPLVKFADRPPFTMEEVSRLWDEYPNANIALKTDKFFVIDIDVHGINGFESLKNWKHLDLIKPTLQAKTASGGKHLFYLKRDDANIGQQIGFLPGVDIKAHDNNYVLVAPSATDKGTYEWDLVKSPAKGTMMTASKDLIQAINRENKTSSGLRELYYQSVNHSGKSKTTHLFETILYGFGDTGGRNDKLAKFAGGLLARGVDSNDVLSLCLLANSNGIEQINSKELERTVESMIKKHERR
ncbi:DNA primase [Lactococcus sp. dk322]|nr:DNA primase [Lactococcus sp. dk101]TXK37137.1 DNA primase [Lactococcus sp. dk310]TXK47991.1 DNA primase [Lactococcus sp. dk322]